MTDLKYAAQVNRAIADSYIREASGVIPPGTTLGVLRKLNGHKRVTDETDLQVTLRIGAKAPAPIHVPRCLRTTGEEIDAETGIDVLAAILRQDGLSRSHFGYGLNLKRIVFTPEQRAELGQGRRELFGPPVVFLEPGKDAARKLGLRVDFTIADLLSTLGTKSGMTIMPKPLSLMTPGTKVRYALGDPLWKYIAMGVQAEPDGLGPAAGVRAFHALVDASRPMRMLLFPPVRFLARPGTFSTVTSATAGCVERDELPAERQVVSALFRERRFTSLPHLCIAVFLAKLAGQGVPYKRMRIATEALTEQGHLVVAQIHDDKIELDAVELSHDMETDLMVYQAA